jgi:hypothetical protein
LEKHAARQRVAEAGNGKEAITKGIAGRDLAKALYNFPDNRPARYKLEKAIRGERTA